MASGEQYSAMTFVRDRFSQSREGRTYPCADRGVARKVAEDWTALGWAWGAAVLAFLCPGAEFHEGETVTLAAFGEVPREVQDQMPF